MPQEPCNLKLLSAMDSALISQNHTLLALPVQDSGAAAIPFLRDYAIHEINTILWALLIVITGVLLKRVAHLFWLWALGSRFPGPPSSVLSGHSSRIAKAGGHDGFSALLSELHEEYGPTVRLWLGPTRLLVSIKDQRLVDEVLQRARDRPPGTGKALHLVYGKSNFFPASFFEAKKRRVLFNEELNGKVMGTVEVICNRVLGHLKDTDKLSTSGEGVDSKSFSQHLAFSVLGATLFGDSFFSWSAVDEFEKLLLRIANEACFWSTFSIMPFWNKRFRTYRNNCYKLQRLTEDIIAKCSQHRDKALASRSSQLADSNSCMEAFNLGMAAGYKGTGLDLSGEMVSGLMRDIGWSGSMNAMEGLRGSLISMMFHGSLTTAGILSGALTRLALHPSVQAKVHAEIDNICGKKLPPTIDDVKNMHYLMATLHESARLLPSGPLLQRCSLFHGLRLSQRLTVPAGAILAIPVQLIQVEKENWGEDAEVFNPDRFLCTSTSTREKANLCRETTSLTNGPICQEKHYMSKDEEEKEKMTFIDTGKDAGSNHRIFKDPYEKSSFLLFGAGSRSCVGRNFAINQMMLLLATLIQEFKIKFGSGGAGDLEPRIENCILHLSPSPKLIFEPRHHH